MGELRELAADLDAELHELEAEGADVAPPPDVTSSSAAALTARKRLLRDVLVARGPLGATELLRAAQRSVPALTRSHVATALADEKWFNSSGKPRRYAAKDGEDVAPVAEPEGDAMGP